MLIKWWLDLLYRLINCVICPGEIEKVLIINNNIMTLGYTYAKRSINDSPDIFWKIAHTGWIIAWYPSRLSWNTSLQGRDQSILCTSLPTAFSGTNNQDGPTTFDTSTRYTLWDPGCTQSVNPYFELYTQYKTPEKGDNAEFNGIGGIVKPKE